MWVPVRIRDRVTSAAKPGIHGAANAARVAAGLQAPLDHALGGVFGWGWVRCAPRHGGAPNPPRTSA